MTQPAPITELLPMRAPFRSTALEAIQQFFTYLYLAGLDFDADPLLAKPMVVVENPDTGTNQRSGAYPYPPQAAYHAVAVHVDAVANLELSVAIDLYIRAG